MLCKKNTEIIDVINNKSYFQDGVAHRKVHISS